MNPTLLRASFCLLTLGLLIALLVPSAFAAADESVTFVVDSTEDGIDINPGDRQCATQAGLCTLRAAVMEANALATADRIELGSGVYYLSITGLFEEQAATGDLDIYGTLTLAGQGMTLTIIDGGGSGMGDRALHVHPGATFRLEGVSVVNADIGMGSNGAGLRNDSGNVVIQGSSFQFSRAHNGAGLMNVGEMVIRNSLIGYNTATDSGAGVRNDGTLEIDSSSILENEVLAGPGAGIQNHGTLVIRNSTISNNRAGPQGGAIYNGYGPLSTGASLTINNSTIFGNLALTGGSTEPTTGGIYNVDASSVHLSNSIVAWNSVDYGSNVDCVGTITSRGYNLFSAVEACTLTGDLTGNILTADPGLGPREEDPAHTASFPLLPGSPALEAGSPLEPGSSASACEPADQRGILRPQVARCDIGAREMEGTILPSPTPPAVFVVGLVTEDGVDAHPGDGVCATAEGRCTLRAAVMETNALPTADRIELGPLVYYLTIPGAGEDGAATGDLDILGDLEIIGSGIYNTLIDGGGSDVGDRTLHVHPGVDFRMSGAGVANARLGTGGDGGALFNDRGYVSLDGTAFQYNFARNGGALMNTGELMLRRTLIYGNDASDAGGGIRNEGHLEIYESTVGGNHVYAGPGGGIDNRAELDLWNLTVTGNDATHLAAGIYNGPPVPNAVTRLRINSATIYTNMLTTESAGTGGVYNEPGSEALISNTILSGNANSLGESSCWGTLSSGGHNLFGTSPDCVIDGNTLGNLYGLDSPGLGMLSGVSAAPVHPLLPGSPAIDAGKLAPVGGDETACPFTDQRGVPRPQGAACDIGAYESEDVYPPTLTPVTPPVITYTVTPTPTVPGTPPVTRTPSATPTVTRTRTPSATPIPSPRTWSTTIDDSRALFGYSVSGAGDVNGDKYDDLIIGARDYDYSKGAAFLFYGAPEGPRDTPDWAVYSNQQYAYMGRSVGGAGDVNGDGYDDVLVGVPQYSSAQTSAGAVFAYYGSPSGPSISPDWSAVGDQASALFGWSVRGAGDINRDGFDDVVIGARYFSGGQEDEGKAYVYLGSPSGLRGIPSWEHEIDISDAGFGYSVSGAGDTNGDGYDDVLIGSYNYIYGQLDGGKAYLFLGSPSGLAESPAWIGESPMSLDSYGYAVGHAGDVNSDGYDDILVGAPAGDTSAEGKVYLYLGSPEGPSAFAAWVGQDGGTSTRYGDSLAGACDFNNDGHDDMFVGDPNDGRGKVYLYLGGPSGPAASSNLVMTSSTGSALGSALGGAGDVDGDRYCDLLVGDPVSGSFKGRALLYYGFSVNPEFPTITPSPSATLTSTPTPLPSGLFFDGFEIGDLSAWSSAETDQGDLSVSPGAALGGAYGLHADIDDNRSLYVVDTTPVNESAYAARFYFDPNGIAMASGNAHLLFKALDAASRTLYQIELRSYQGDYQVRAQALGDSGSATNTSWFRLDDDVHAIETIWQAASADGVRDGSLTLWLDGELAASLAGLDNDTLRVESVRLGAVAGIDSGTRGSYFFDAFGSTAGGAIGPDSDITLPSPPPTPDAVFADGFESGDLSAWSAVTNGTDLSVNSSAALGGGFGLEAIVDDTAPRYVSDWSPVSLKAYAARFYFDPNGITMASGNSHVLFKAMDAASKTTLQLEFRSFQGDYQIRAYTPWDSGGAYRSPWFRLSDDPHLLELIWQAASADGASDGWLSLWIDAEPVASGSGMDNDTRRVDKVDLGAVAGIDSGTSGTYYFDAFASTSGAPIGPDPGAALPEPPSPPDVIFADGFESGELSAWSARKNEGDLLVSSRSALVGGYGLEAIADDTAPRYVTDWGPVAEKEYHVRFVFDPNSLTMMDGRSHVIFQALSGSSKVIARVELRYKSLNYELRSGVLTDANQWVNTGWWYIDDGPQVIELDWRAASRPDSSDGSLTMWINEEQSEGRDGIANSLLQVDLAQMGLVAGVDSGTLGSMLFDAFESRRVSHIGLPDDLATPVPTGTSTRTPTATPTVTPALTLSPDCGGIALNYTDLWDPYVRMSVTNLNPYPIHLTDSTISWGGPGVFPGQALGGMHFTRYYWTGNDPVSPSSHAPEQPIAVAAGATTLWYGYFFIDAPPLYGSYSVGLTFDDTCVVSGSVNRDPPTVTVTPTLTSTGTTTSTPTRTLMPATTDTATVTATTTPAQQP